MGWYNIAAIYWKYNTFKMYFEDLTVMYANTVLQEYQMDLFLMFN